MFVYDLCMGGCVDATFYYFQLRITSNGQKQQLSIAVKLYSLKIYCYSLYIYIYRVLEVANMSKEKHKMEANDLK